MIVELTGLPGTGKTTFAKHLVESGEWTLVKINGASELIFYNACFLFRHPFIFLRTLLWLCRYLGKRELWYTKFVNLFLVHNAKYTKARKYRRAVIDQGHHQNIVSLFDERVLDSEIDCYARVLPKPDVLVFFVVPDEIRTRRLNMRGYGARDEMSGEYKDAWNEAQGAHFERLYLSRSMLSCVAETVSPEDEEHKLAKVKHARIFRFVLHGRMPTEKAHGLQIAKTLEALTERGGYVTLWIPRRKNIITSSVEAYYDIRSSFTVRTFCVPDFLELPVLFGALRFWIDGLGFFVRLAFVRIDQSSVFFTRNPELAWLFKVKGASVWYEAHLFPESKSWLLKFFLAHTDGIIANSKGTAEAFIGRKFHNVHVVRNGVDVARFFDTPTKEESRVILGLPQEKTIIVYTGAFYAWKGVPFLLETWRKHFSGRDDLLLVLVGGREDDLKKHGGFDAYRGVKNVLLTPHLPTEKIPLYTSAADTLLLPNLPISEESIRYTSPIKLFEYMASGKPIVAADLPSICEIVSDETAILFHAGDGEALAGAITATLRDVNDAKLRGSRARAQVAKYSWKARAELLMNIVRGHARNRTSAHAQFMKTIMAGVFAATYYLALVYLLTTHLGLPYMLSVLIGCAVVFIVNFLFLKAIFIGGARNVGNELSRYAMLSLVNFFLNETVTYLLVEKLHVWYMLAQFFIVGALAIMNFFVYRSHVFERGEK